MNLATMCGFNDEKNFEITGEMIREEINSKADVYVARRTGDSYQLVLIWEEKLSRRQKSEIGRSAVLLQNSAAQIIGEMLSVHWQNNQHNHEPCEVYAFRLTDDMVAFFKMDMSTEQIKAVFKDGVIPDPKLQIGYTPRHALDAGRKYGVSLLHPCKDLGAQGRAFCSFYLAEGWERCRR
eukprot:TRINITY_DN1217_c1_g1_i2.p1 TRINITY_DN1217_c1_g1~~TRINITY_DN1217_c1_g1_i2.p1  ORF type:complete len:180 (+),score=31.84 TRINITY_DN1217_c1_g1_i2:674-1213(+)